MPITPHVRDRVIASALACRLIKAVGRQGVELEEATLRALRLAWHTTDLLLDTPDRNSPVDRAKAEVDLTRLAADGQVLRTALGDDALWTLR